jgi:hypothetical protein
MQSACGGIKSNPATIMLQSLQSYSPSIVKLPTTYRDTLICTIQYKIWYCLHGKALLPWRSPHQLVHMQNYHVVRCPSMAINSHVDLSWKHTSNSHIGSKDRSYQVELEHLLCVWQEDLFS